MKLLAVQFFSVPCHLLSLTPQISPSTPYFRTPSAYVPPSMWQTKFHTRTKQQAKLEFYTFQSLYSWTSHRKTKDSAPTGSRHCLSLACSWYLLQAVLVCRCRYGIWELAALSADGRRVPLSSCTVAAFVPQKSRSNVVPILHLCECLALLQELKS